MIALRTPNAKMNRWALVAVVSQDFSTLEERRGQEGNAQNQQVL
jgi:hypothetical protein